MPLRNVWRRRGRRQTLALALSLAALAALGALAGCMATGQAADAPALPLKLVHTNDTMGVIEPCG